MKKPLRNLKPLFASVFLMLAFSVSGLGQITLNAWNTNGLSGITPDGWSATTTAGNVGTGQLSRGAGVTPTSLANGFSASGWAETTLANAKTGIDYFQFYVLPSDGFKLTVTGVHFRTRRTTTGPTNLQLSYSLNGTDFTDVGDPITGYTNTTDGFSHPVIDLSAISELINISGTVTFRLYGWGASSVAGTLAIGVSGAANNDLTILGTVSPLDTYPPAATFTPPNGAVNVPVDVNPLVTFNELIYTTAGVAVDNTNVAGLITFKQTDASGANVPFAATIADGKVITIIPDSQLDNDQVYYLAVAPVKDASGNESTAQSITFTTVGVTTYEVKFEITHKGIPFPGAQVYMAGYGSRWTDENGIATYSQVLPAVDIPFTVTKLDIETFQGEVTVTDANVIVPVAVTKIYQIVFFVTDGSVPVSGAKVEFDGQEVFTSESGYAIFEGVREGVAKPYMISKIGFITKTGTLDVDDSLTQVNIILEKVKVNITFNVSDDSGPVQGALVDFNNTQITTGTDGKAVFTDVVYGLGIPYTVTRAGYHTLNGTVDAITDKDVNVTIVLVRYTVTFTVSQGTNPVSGAIITVSGQTPVTTNPSGVANLNLVPGSYTYSVTATGFVEVTDIGFTVVNTSLNIPVSLSAVNIDLPGSPAGRLTAYPNPSNGLFTLKIPNTPVKRVSVEILDITGKLVFRVDYPAEGSLNESIDLQHLNKGMYFLRVSEGERISTVKLIFR